MQSNFQEALNLIQKGQPDLAEKKLKLVLKNTPSDESALSLLGHSLLAQQKNKDAVNTFLELVKFHPKSDNARVELATAHLALKDFNKAEIAFHDAVNLNPKQSEAWLFLGNFAMKKGQRDRAKQCFQNADKYDPFNDVMLAVEEQIRRQQFAEAEKNCRHILQKHQSHPGALAVMADIATRAGALEEAIKILSQGLERSPYNVKLIHNLCKTYSSLGRYQQAIEQAQKLVLIDPGNEIYWVVLGGELSNIGNNEESIQAYQKAIEIAPQLATAHLLLGHILKIAGNREACEKAYQKVIELGDIQGAAFWALADLKSYQFSAEDRSKMAAYFNDKNNNQSQRCQAGFALAKALEDVQDYETSFHYYKSANELRPGATFDAAEYAQICSRLRDAFSQQVLTLQANKQQGPQPIFIVGLPRSGSTLIEQILASHSQVEGTMELYSLPNLVRRINILGGKRSGKAYPDSISQFSEEELTFFGQSYLDETAMYRTQKPYFIDKLPPNFQQIGLIHKILPGAIIIDARRHPMSCGLSAFKQHFASGHGFSYKLEHIGKYYRNYLELVDYWQAELPGKVLTVQYEKMVRDTETQIRELLAHCGLEFEVECLEFYKNKRAVKTASSEQVRQPIYTNSTQQWHNFESHLEPLKTSLGESTYLRFLEWE